ncbi:MAG: glycosyltransferase, partial [Acutalibacteraceae bacterium]
DIYSFAPKGVSNIVNGAYVQMTLKAPKVFTSIYNLGHFLSKNMETSPVYAFNSLYKKNYLSYLEENQFDVVVVSHIFAGEAMRCAKKHGAKIKVVFISTDYTCVPMTAEGKCDYYIIPTEYQREDNVKKGVPDEKIYPLGIPVEKKFQEKMDKKEARKILGFSEKKTILIMSGSMGFGNPDTLAKKLSDRFGDSVNIIILCGRNKKLYKSLSKTFAYSENVMPCEFTDKVSIYMDASDVVFTKPGGLSSTECAVKNIPFIHTPPIPGCETCNAEFFSKMGMSVAVKDEDEAVSKCFNLLNNNELREKIMENQRKYINENALEDICNFILSIEKE